MSVEDVELPELSRERQDEIEQALFSQIGAEHARATATSHHRRRTGWLLAGAAAAVVIVAGFLGPALGGAGVGVVSSGAGGSSAEDAPDAELWSHPDAPDDLADDGGPSGVDEGEDAAGGGDAAGETAREVIARAYVSLEAEEPSLAVDEVGRAAEDVGGYVESMSIGGGVAPGAEDAPADSADQVTSSEGGSSITVRVPASDLTAFLNGLAEYGEVRSSEITRDDVTAEATDLRARADALEASVDRLQQLITDATSTAALLDAEGALTQRQAELDSLRAQLTAIEDQVALSSVEVAISGPQAAVAADPQGFGDGLATGWNALLATLNGVVIGLGFLLPWLAIGAVVLVTVRLVRRGRRRRRAAEGASAD